MVTKICKILKVYLFHSTIITLRCLTEAYCPQRRLFSSAGYPSDGLCVLLPVKYIVVQQGLELPGKEDVPAPRGHQVCPITAEIKFRSSRLIQGHIFWKFLSKLGRF